MRLPIIKVTRSLGAALTDSDKFGWRVSYFQREFDTRELAEAEADRLRHAPTAAEEKAINEGRFVDEEQPCNV